MRELQNFGKERPSGERDRAEMLDLERGLREAMRPVELPAGFAERVRNRIAERERLDVGGAQRERAGALTAATGRSRRWRSAIAAAVFLALVGGGWDAASRVRRQAEEAQAKRQFDLAMQVTVRSLEKASRGLERRTEGAEER